MAHDVRAAADRAAKHADPKARLHAIFDESQAHLDADLKHAETLGSAEAAVAHIREGAASWSRHRDHIVNTLAA